MDILYLDARNSVPLVRGPRYALYIRDGQLRITKSYSLERTIIGAEAAFPIGGTVGQVLKKASNANYDFVWANDLTEGEGGGSVAWGAITGSLANQSDLQTELNSKASSSHAHAIGDTTGLQTALDGKAAVSHSHTIANVTGLQTALDGKAAVSHTHSGIFTLVNKTSDEARVNNTLANDGALVFSMAASTRYAVRGMIALSSHTTPDFKFRFVGPTAALVRGFRRYVFAGSMSHTFVNAYDTSDIPINFTGMTQSFLVFEYIVQNTSAGTFAFQWAQETTSAGNPTTVHAGSHLEYQAL